MSGFPWQQWSGLSKADRQQIRDGILDRKLAEARLAARRVGRSLKCQYATEHPDAPHCANDGSTCICECHDPAESTEGV